MVVGWPPAAARSRVAVRDYGVGLKPRRGDAGLQPLLAGRPGARPYDRRHRPRAVHRAGGRPAARRLAPGVGRAGRRFAVPADAAAHGGRRAARLAAAAGARRLPAQRGRRRSTAQAQSRRRTGRRRRARRRRARLRASAPESPRPIRGRRDAAGSRAAPRAGAGRTHDRRGGRAMGTERRPPSPAGAVHGALGRCRAAAVRLRLDAGRRHVDRVDSSHRGRRRLAGAGVRREPAEGRAPAGDRPRLPGGDDERRGDVLDGEGVSDRGTADDWDPFASTTVLSGGPSPGKATARTGDERGLHRRGVGHADRRGGRRARLRARRGRATAGVPPARWTGEWRIDRLPDGLVLGESDFQRIYRSINNYYYAKLGSDAGVDHGRQERPRRRPGVSARRIDPVTETVEALLAGPDAMARPGGRLVLPATVPRLARRPAPVAGRFRRAEGAAEREGRGRRRAAVRPDGRAGAAHGAGQASAKVSKVGWRGPDGYALCELTREQAEDVRARPAQRPCRAASTSSTASTGSRPSTAPARTPGRWKGRSGQGEAEMGAVAVNRATSGSAAVSRGRPFAVRRGALAEDSRAGQPGADQQGRSARTTG